MTYRDSTGFSRLRKFFASACIAAATLAMPQGASTAFAAPYDRPDLERIEGKVRSAAGKAMPAVVALTHSLRGGMASGTGTIISKDGIILSAAHVLAGAEEVDVTFLDGHSLKAKVLGADATRDVALARIEKQGDYPFVEMGRSGELKVGDAVVAIGHSGGFDPRRTPPVRYGRIFLLDAGGFLRSDCVLVGGDSGGPLLNLDGKLIGVHSNIGPDTSINNDAPVDAVHDGWKRMLDGERWGKPLIDSGGPRRGNSPRGERAPAPQPPSDVIPLTDEERAGLNVDHFRTRIIDNGLKNGGKLELSPQSAREWLRQDGMKADRVDAMSDKDVVSFIQHVMGSSAQAKAGGPPTTQPVATQPSGLPADLNVRKFSRLVTREAAKNNGRLQVAQPQIAGWLKQSGMKAEEVDALSAADIVGLMEKALRGNGGSMQVGRSISPQEARIITDQDTAILATVQPDLEKVVPSIVTMTDGDAPEQVLALGTIVRADGFILTKRSEAAKAKSGLFARFTDGRSLPATVVKEFPQHDLALVKVAAHGLAAVAFDANRADLQPGEFVFAPSPSAKEPMLGAGVVSVATRSLIDSGGYLGVGMDDADGTVKIAHIVPGSPAAKAGLKEGDIIVAVDGKPVTKSTDLSHHVRELKPGSVAKFTYRRGNDPQREVAVTLADRAKLPTNDGRRDPMLSIGTRISDVSTGFPSILQHDQPISPQECGGPIVDLEGHVAALNIARAGRVATYAIPASVLGNLLHTVDFDKLAAPASATAPAKEK